MSHTATTGREIAPPGTRPPSLAPPVSKDPAVGTVPHCDRFDAYRRQGELGAPLRRTEDAREAQRASSRSDVRFGRESEFRKAGGAR